MKKIIFTLLIIFGTYLQVIAGNDTALSYEDHKKFDYFYLEALRQKLNGQHSEAFQSLQHALSIDSNLHTKNSSPFTPHILLKDAQCHLHLKKHSVF